MSIIVDNGGRRSGIERRQFAYNGHLPERRSDADRRSGMDRRKTRYEKSDTTDRRKKFDFM